MDKISKEIADIHLLLVSPVDGGDMLTEQDRQKHFSKLQQKLEKKSMLALEYVMEDIKVTPLRSAAVPSMAHEIHWRRADLAKPRSRIG